jgi:uncharacterized protein YkwD
VDEPVPFDPQEDTDVRSVALWAAIVGAIAGLAAAAVPEGADAAPGCAATPLPADEAALTAMINQARTAQGVARVTRDRVLRAAGRRKSMAMAKGAAFAHASGELPWARGRAAGQNIAMATSAGAAFKAMLESPGHRHNLMGRGWGYTGVGAAARCDGMLFVTINFMAPPA